MIRATSAWLSVLVAFPCVHYCIIRFVRNASREFRERVRVWTIAVIHSGLGFQRPPWGMPKFAFNAGHRSMESCARTPEMHSKH